MIKLYTVRKKTFPLQMELDRNILPQLWNTHEVGKHICWEMCFVSRFLVSESARSNRCPAVKIFKTKAALITQN